MVAERGPKKRRDYLASWSVMSVRLQDQASCLRERSRREDPATTRAVHELDLRDQDVENVYWAWRTTLSYDASFVLTCSLDRENPGNYDRFHFLPWCFGGSSKLNESLDGSARLVLHPSETLDRRLRFFRVHVCKSYVGFCFNVALTNIQHWPQISYE